MSKAILYILLGATGIPVFSMGITLLMVKHSESVLPGFKNMKATNKDALRRISGFALTAMSLIIIISSLVFVKFVLAGDAPNPFTFITIYAVTVVIFLIVLILGIKRNTQR
jgi:hypothetical protein